MRGQIKVLNIILDGFPTFRPDIAALWGKYLPREHVFSDVCTIQNKESASLPWASGDTFLYQPARHKIIEQLGAFAHDCKVLWQTRNNGYAAIQVRDKSFICLVAMLIARYQKIPFFYWMSFPIADSLVKLASNVNKQQHLVRWLYLMWRGQVGGYLLYKYVLPKADHVFVQSDRMLQDLVAKGADASNMTPVPMCIDPDRFQSVLPVTPQKRRVIGYLGECSRVRRIDFLFEAVALVKQTIPEVQLLIVGDAYEASDKQWLADAIERLGLQDHVVITGWLPAPEATTQFATTEVALALMAPDPLLDSTTPTKLVEYLAMGRPVVANNHPDQSFVIHASQGGLCVPFEAAEYAKAIITLLNNPSQSQEMAQAGRKWVMSQRSYDQMAKRLAIKYQQMTC